MVLRGEKELDEVDLEGDPFFAAMKLPPVLFYTSTRDDRVHPAHARKMAAKMEAMGYVVDYYENTEGGHHGSVTNEQLATRLARTYTFLWEHVGRQK